MENRHRLTLYFDRVYLRSAEIHLFSPPLPPPSYSSSSAQSPPLPPPSYSSSSAQSPPKLSLRIIRLTTEYLYNADNQSYEEYPHSAPVVIHDMSVGLENVGNDDEVYCRVYQSLDMFRLDEESLPTITARAVTKIMALKQEICISYPDFRVLSLTVKITRVDFFSLSEFSAQTATRLSASIAALVDADDQSRDAQWETGDEGWELEDVEGEPGEPDEEIGEADDGLVPASEISIKKMLKRVTITGVEAPDEPEAEESGNNNKRRKTSRSLDANTCMICLEAMLVGSHAMQLPCSHVFHNNCVEDWLKASHYCPLCRFEFPAQDP